MGSLLPWLLLLLPLLLLLLAMAEDAVVLPSTPLTE